MIFYKFDSLIIEFIDLMRQNFSLKTTIFISVRERTFRLSQRQNNLWTEVGRNNPTLLTIFSLLLWCKEERLGLGANYRKKCICLSIQN